MRKPIRDNLPQPARTSEWSGISVSAEGVYWKIRVARHGSQKTVLVLACDTLSALRLELFGNDIHGLNLGVSNEQFVSLREERLGNLPGWASYFHPQLCSTSSSREIARTESAGLR